MPFNSTGPPKPQAEGLKINKIKSAIESANVSRVIEEDLVWYAAYDEDIGSEFFMDKFKIIPLKSRQCKINGF
jgi:hypothetical protein